LKNKKVLLLEKYLFGRSQYQNKKALFTDSIFREGFGVIIQEIRKLNFQIVNMECH
jgi:hypothetical protein